MCLHSLSQGKPVPLGLIPRNHPMADGVQAKLAFRSAALADEIMGVSIHILHISFRRQEGHSSRLVAFFASKQQRMCKLLLIRVHGSTSFLSSLSEIKALHLPNGQRRGRPNRKKLEASI
jgi:hypothetical protein